MATIAELVDSMGGIAQKRSLAARGARDIDLTRAVKAGEVIRARQGWYTTLPAHSPAVRAIRVGGRLTGISAVEAAGGWAVGHHPLHVSLPQNAARLRSQFDRRVRLDPANANGVALHWDAAEVSERGTVSSVGMADALNRVIRDEPFEQAVVAFDWALKTGTIDRFELEQLILGLPAPMRNFGEWVDENCDSPPESLSRTRLRISGHHVVSQVLLDTGEEIDLLVDDCVAVEVDGDEHHRERFERDRSKDLTMTIAGYHAIRPSARAVFWHWDRVEAAIQCALDGRGAGPPSRIQDFGNSTRRRIPKLSEFTRSTPTVVLNFRRQRE